MHGFCRQAKPRLHTPHGRYEKIQTQQRQLPNCQRAMTWHVPVGAASSSPLPVDVWKVQIGNWDLTPINQLTLSNHVGAFSRG
jgi:hypothetical protein